MKENFENKRKVISMLLISLTVIIIVIMAVCILGNKTKDNEVNKSSQNTENNMNTINFVTTSDGIKENISKRIKEEQKVQYLTISNAKLTCENGISKLTAEVSSVLRNTSDLKLKVTILGNDSKMIGTKKIEVEDIKKDETKNINIEFDEDVSNASSIRYEIMR